MKKILLTGVFCAFATSAFAGGNNNCVDYEWIDPGFDYWVNNCSYEVYLRGTFNNGYIGDWGPLAPGQRSPANPGSDATRVSWVYCNWSKKPGCSPK